MRHIGILLAVMVFLPVQVDSAPDRPPNILVMMADDWNWPHLPGIDEPNVSMPTFDWLCREEVFYGAQ